MADPREAAHLHRFPQPEIFDRNGTKLYDLKGINTYRLSELIGHLNDASVSDKRLDKATDGLFT
ncbi:hypothetical protein CQ13_35985 [Bradyrhizobium retamae]|uniref:Uncharacterized protein n=1 Tax=Bradyrhizobium retamae TaxID=1300035 RepID=A0A0R3MCU8_9BRAD|nr:hypothetical protein CQ13_35985 [Bradyrhizobium retamae]